MPAIVSFLQEFIDRDRRPGRWILTGSQNFALLESVSQSLAGRTAMCQLLPLAWSEVKRTPEGPRRLQDTLLVGGYPQPLLLSATSSHTQAPHDWSVLSAWFESYVTAYVERDVRQLLRVTDLDAFQRFIQLVAVRSGQLLNMASLAGDVGVSQPTVKSWLGVLEASFLVVRLLPFHANLGKRLVRTPKVHFLDSGLLCHLLGIRTPEQLAGHPLRGAVFEGWVVAELLKSRVNRGLVSGTAARLAFARDEHGVEVDAVCESVSQSGRPLLRLVEVKFGETVSGEWFRPGRSMAKALSSTYDVECIVIYGGNERQGRRDGTVLPWTAIDTLEW